MANRSKTITTYSDGSITVVSDAPPPDDASVPEPLDSFLVVVGDGQTIAVVLHDPDDSRSRIDETNATQPLERWADDLHALSGKDIVDINNTTWVSWMVDMIGQEQYDRMNIAGKGYFDLGVGKLMCSNSAGDRIIVERIYTKTGTKYCICEVLDFWSFPEKIDGIWYYKGQSMDWITHPQYFNMMTNKVSARQETWITQGGYNAKSDARVGRQYWPLIAKHAVGHPMSDLRFYPTLPANLLLHDKSVISEGDLVPTTSREIAVDAYRFRGSETFIREQGTGLWYLAETFLDRTLPGYAANGYDYICFVSMPGKVEPWMGHRGYPSPDPVWMRKDVTTLQIVLNKIRETLKRLI